MSKYEVNKAMRSVVLMTADEFIVYQEDRRAMLDGHDLTGAERAALVNVDYATLYANGAHPFLLNGFTMRAWPGERATLRKEYGENIEQYGYPRYLDLSDHEGGTRRGDFMADDKTPQQVLDELEAYRRDFRANVRPYKVQDERTMEQMA